MISRKELANAIRILTIDAIYKAQSGHPGAPMGMADIAEVLWRDYLNHNPNNPRWINRDRFVLSNGHASMLIYSILHLTGYNLSIKDLKSFRTINSKTPGHPEIEKNIGIETTTGPLGQGLANGIGFAISEKLLSKQFNKKEFDIINHYTYVFVGDGCMMEGISHEVCSLAGKLKLNKLIVFYDDNGISIDGQTKNYFIENITQRFKAYKWNVISNIDGHNSEKIKESIKKAKKESEKPSLIICKTIIGYGSPNKSGTNEIHGSPLNKEEILLTREKLKWKYKPFFIPQIIYKLWDAREKGENQENKWNKKFKSYKKIYPNLCQELKRRVKRNLPVNWKKDMKNLFIDLKKNKKNISTRKASQNIINNINKILPEYLGGSADLSASNLTTSSNTKDINTNDNGNYIYYGVREFGMTAIANGISIYGGFIPSTATFLTFFDYAKNAVRMASLMNIRQILIYTHDSIGVGEDGPTHQPVEQIANIRSIPNINLWRPCDQIETFFAWKYAIENKNSPTTLILSRQDTMYQKRNKNTLNKIKRGGYIIRDNSTKNKPQLIIIATGSEVQLAVKAYDKLISSGYKIRIISMPSTDIFDKQNKEYRESILPSKIKKRIAIEASYSDYWFKYIGLDGIIIGMKTFGKSGKNEDLFKNFGFTTNNIIKKAKSIL
ncbi:transketolase [Candidatus Purcelliella pentastirinorum]|uniref:Transketolase n=1 Tax=Candidatus Purcelliella pentastirinorum TaxID=472834 RepID=A0AAX3N7Y2_9ENTR|nr:transketolase [Candidatus Purcelliella pentastirinorum]WDI78677.1 transketolase [Candidatus Purcelliella pentastirinorum]